MTPGPGVVDNLCRWSFSYALNVSKFKIVDAKQTLSGRSNYLTRLDYRGACTFLIDKTLNKLSVTQNCTNVFKIS